MSTEAIPLMPLRSKVTAVMDEGRLHVGFGKANELPSQLGPTLKVYESGFIKFFAILFGVAFSIKIDGNYYCVNSNSFKKHCDVIGDQKEILKLIKDGFIYDAVITSKAALNGLSVSKAKLSARLSFQTRYDLLQKMVEIFKNNTMTQMDMLEIKKLARQGALLDWEFYVVPKCWTHGGEKSEFFMTLEDVNKYYSGNFAKCRSCTPLVFATANAHTELAEFFYRAKDGSIENDRVDSIEFRSEAEYSSIGSFLRYTTHELAMEELDDESEPELILNELTTPKLV